MEESKKSGQSESAGIKELENFKLSEAARSSEIKASSGRILATCLIAFHSCLEFLALENNELANFFLERLILFSDILL